MKLQRGTSIGGADPPRRTDTPQGIVYTDEMLHGLLRAQSLRSPIGSGAAQRLESLGDERPSTR